MQKNILIQCLFLLTAFTGSAQDFYPQAQAEKYAKIALKEKNLYLVKVDLPGNFQTEKTEPISVFQFTGAENFVDGFIVYTQAKGRYDYFDYLIVTTSEPSVQKIKVLKYRSEHGGEIAARKWLKQFENYSSGELKYGKDISAISGATISAGSITTDIPKVLAILKGLNN